MAPTADVLELLRPDLRELEPYRAAEPRHDLERLHANELPWSLVQHFEVPALNRYPVSSRQVLAEALGRAYGVDPGTVLATRGSDDAIDLLARAFCRAGEDAVVVCPPTFGMYAVCARLQGAHTIAVPLLSQQGFALDVDAVADACNDGVKLVFVCSPNNPTGNLIPAAAIEALLERIGGRALVVVDEAYIEFAHSASLAPMVRSQPHLAVLRTLSKAHGLAGARCGALIAHPALIAALDTLVPPYAFPSLTLSAALAHLTPEGLERVQRSCERIRRLREDLREGLECLPSVRRVWPSEANFLLTRTVNAAAAEDACREAGLLVRPLGAQPGLADHLRITVGDDSQNARLLGCLAELSL